MVRDIRTRLVFAVTALVAWCGLGVTGLEASETLDIYFIYAGGSAGNATLLVAPSGESMMLDVGPPYTARHVLNALKQAGVSQVDYLVNTHFHDDHFGATAELATKIKVVNFVDHGESVELGKTDDWWKQRRAPWFRPGMGNAYDAKYDAYLKARETGRHIVVQAGDVIPIKGIEARVICAGGKVIPAPLPGAGESIAACAEVERRDDDDCEDAQSIGVVVSYGSFRFAYLGDLTWNVANDLFCPRNRVGAVDAYVITHHAQSFPKSMGDYYYGLSACPRSELAGLRPRVAILSLGAHGHKNGTPDAMETVRTSPRLEDLWQTEYIIEGGEKDHNAPRDMIANTEGQTTPARYFIKLSASLDGSFTMTNGRNGFTKRYPPRTN
jgi:glyoxylase-like metal-dependent hydrolase (beta-lactamase superfamily II)